jgi:hypothetical protein
MDDVTRRALLAATAAGGILKATAAVGQTNEPIDPATSAPGSGCTDMTADHRILRLEPQNLISGLPVRHEEAVN